MPASRAPVKLRHRRAIVDAAAALLEEREGLHFTIDDLALRAGLSRRTVFNHFSSVDDILASVFADVIGTLVDTYDEVPPSGDDTASVFDELAQAVRSTDLVPPMAYLTRSLRSEHQASPRLAPVLLRVLSEVTERLVTAVRTRHPSADVLDVHLLVNGIIAGLFVLHRHWWAATGATDDEHSRRVWQELLERLLDGVGRGHRRPGSP